MGAGRHSWWLDNQDLTRRMLPDQAIAEIIGDYLGTGHATTREALPYLSEVTVFQIGELL